MGSLSSQFKVLFRLTVALMRIAGYTVVFVVQIPWFLACDTPQQIPAAFGHYGRAVIDAFANVLDT